ncbi:Shedu immune nuclease family protein [Microvirga thermotolerans]|uniref:DUF4263 domain-containing protein n=1 Tax=Microvirga thermotolerans TaxID=2651334 RepID=A0A5P9JVD0_9HYPH|nr:Shedu immune nuclease family protein [Microvirga thermotolerans]QFU16567.1 DUF4263 domain-containing protein [Microvirga thermotolerans]
MDDKRLRRPPAQTFISKAFPDGLTGKKVRIATRKTGSPEDYSFAIIKDDLSIRVSPGSGKEIKANFFETEGGIRVLTIQKFNKVSGPSDRDYFSFVGREIDALAEFILHFNGKRATAISDDDARRVVTENEELLGAILESETLKRDLVAVGYRRKQLGIFERLLSDQEYFELLRERKKTTPEGLWQRFFEANSWIFGYGLSYQFLTNLDDRKLEQSVRGNDLLGSGKRVDALMKTQAYINAVCFIEIKRHDTPLLASQPYRADVWAPSAELVGGVSQVQVTVDKAIDQLGKSFETLDGEGNPLGETLFNFEPRSFLVVGSLSELQTENGVNKSKYRSFELYRRNVRRPEIITFDEVLYRAKFIVDDGITRSQE